MKKHVVRLRRTVTISEYAYVVIAFGDDEDVDVGVGRLLNEMYEDDVNDLDWDPDGGSGEPDSVDDWDVYARADDQGADFSTPAATQQEEEEEEEEEGES